MMSSNTRRTSSLETDQKTTSAHIRGVKKHHKYVTKPHNRTRKPHNWNEIKRMVAQSRPTLLTSEFSDGAFENFKQAQDDPCLKTTVMSMIFPTTTGPSEIPALGNMSFGDSKPMSNDILVDPKSDFYDGARPAQIDRRLRDELASSITPFAHEHAPALPNYFIKVRGPDESESVALGHAFHDGIIGARAMHKLQSHGAESLSSTSLHDNNRAAYTLTSLYNRGRLTIYAVYPHIHHHPSSTIDPPNVPSHYEIHPLHNWDLTKSRTRFQKGVTGLRNALEWARAQRDDIIATANVRALGMPGEVPLEDVLMEG